MRIANECAKIYSMITLKQIFVDDGLYNWAMELLAISFPIEERRDDELQRQVMSHPDYRLQAIMDGDEPVGVVGYFDAPNFIYFENFCIAPNKRNSGYGSQTLKLLTSKGKTFILEIELPTDDITRRRKAFYERNGMVVNPYPHVQPHYRKDDPDLPLVVLTYGKQLTQSQYVELRHYLDVNVDVQSKYYAH